VRQDRQTSLGLTVRLRDKFIGQIHWVWAVIAATFLSAAVIEGHALFAVYALLIGIALGFWLRRRAA
jgi:hypothetical protein